MPVKAVHHWLSVKIFICGQDSTFISFTKYKQITSNSLGIYFCQLKFSKSSVPLHSEAVSIILCNPDFLLNSRFRFRLGWILPDFGLPDGHKGFNILVFLGLSDLSCWVRWSPVYLRLIASIGCFKFPNFQFKWSPVWCCPKARFEYGAFDCLSVSSRIRFPLVLVVLHLILISLITSISNFFAIEFAVV